MSEEMIEKWKHDAWQGESLGRRIDMKKLEKQLEIAREAMTLTIESRKNKRGAISTYPLERALLDMEAVR